MTSKVTSILLALAAVASAEPTTKTDKGTTKTEKKAKAAEKEPIFIIATDLKWAPAPPELPRGAEVAVLFGDPTKPGRFVMRLKAPDGYKVPPHWHTNDEELTILGGTLNLYMGDDMTSPHALDAGAFHFLPGTMHHAAAAKGNTIVQISGNGPFDIHYLNPADNPVPKAANR